jgi:hypothetical protein
MSRIPWLTEAGILGPSVVFGIHEMEKSHIAILKKFNVSNRD